MSPNKVRITITDGMGRKRVHEDTIDPRERTPSIAAKELLDAAVILRDGDVIEVSFLTVEEQDEARDCDAHLADLEESHWKRINGEMRERDERDFPGR